MRTIIASVLLGGSLVAGCTSPAGRHPSATPSHRATIAPAPTRSTSVPKSSSATAKGSQGGLTGFGATRTEWNAAHTADPNAKLVKGCCYGPIIDTVDQADADTYLLSASAPDVVSAITRNFAPHTTEVEALADLRDDLPPDAVPVQSKIEGGCKEFVYSSKLLAKDPQFDARFSFGLYPPDSDSTYSSSNVEQAIVSAASTLGAC